MTSANTKRNPPKQIGRMSVGDRGAVTLTREYVDGQFKTVLQIEDSEGGAEAVLSWQKAKLLAEWLTEAATSCILAQHDN